MGNSHIKFSFPFIWCTKNPPSVSIYLNNCPGANIKLQPNINHKITCYSIGCWPGYNYGLYPLPSQKYFVLPEILQVSLPCYIYTHTFHCTASVILTHFSGNEAHQLPFNHTASSTFQHPSIKIEQPAIPIDDFFMINQANWVVNQGQHTHCCYVI